MNGNSAKVKPNILPNRFITSMKPIKQADIKKGKIS